MGFSSMLRSLYTVVRFSPGDKCMFVGLTPPPHGRRRELMERFLCYKSDPMAN